MPSFQLESSYKPAGDQPQAIEHLIQGYKNQEQNQVLLGVTGSGKTFTMAHVIASIDQPALILAPNKTLAAQLYGEMKEFFPHNAVEYFVSYYDYYQPEAYIPRTDTYIEKESSINEHIDRLRHSATRSILERKDVIIVASVSCIYGIGSVETYTSMVHTFTRGHTYDMEVLVRSLVDIQYQRNDIFLSRGTFRRKGDTLEIFPSHQEDRAWRFSFFDTELEEIHEIDPLTGYKLNTLEKVTLYPNSHYVTPRPTLEQAIKKIKKDLTLRLQEFESAGKLIEAQRIRERTTFDLEMLETTGICPGIENYSRYLSGRNPGEPPPTLFEYMPPESLFIVDESHISVPQIRGMYRGDAARKQNLSEYGFRLPACKDNRPLTFDEWNQLRGHSIFISATPGPWELEETNGVFVEQVIRPTGLLDPLCFVHPTEHQIDKLIEECLKCQQKNQRVLVTTLTKKMAESLTEYLNEAGLKVRYLHSDINTIERIEIIRDLRLGIFDILVGINLLREGLDIPECALVVILDADKEGYLRSKTSLIQTIGRAARNAEGRALLFADTLTDSMQFAIAETHRRRQKQEAHNHKHHITPQTIQKNVQDVLSVLYKQEDISNPKSKFPTLSGKNLNKHLKKLEKEMLQAAADLEFEKAARLRDEIRLLEQKDLLL